MDTNDSALWVALIGVCGTFGAAALTQLRADRLKKYELAHAAEEQRHAESRADAEKMAIRAREDRILRRSCYADMNTAARQFLTSLVDYRHALQDDGPRSPGAETAASEVEVRRAVHRDRYSEAQMVVPDSVLEALSSANRGMNRLYGILKRIDTSGARPGETVQAAAVSEDPLWEMLALVRACMRHDLGIDSETTTS